MQQLRMDLRVIYINSSQILLIFLLSVLKYAPYILLKHYVLQQFNGKVDPIVKSKNYFSSFICSRLILKVHVISSLKLVLETVLFVVNSLLPPDP